MSPQTVEDVSTAVQNLAQLRDDGQDCLFAVRSGGHTSWAGASNIDNGPTIDLRALDAIKLSPDKTVISAGVGATWDELYEALDPYGLSVNGGRAAGVGKIWPCTDPAAFPRFRKVPLDNNFLI